VLLRSRAVVEVAAAMEWYDLQRSGLGLEFLEAINEAIERIRDHPRSAPELRGAMRRTTLKRFPYGVFYILDEAAIVILAIVHSRRSDATWPQP
jgi:toxin ParE1/3/4